MKTVIRSNMIFFPNNLSISVFRRSRNKRMMKIAALLLVLAFAAQTFASKYFIVLLKFTLFLFS